MIYNEIIHLTKTEVYSIDVLKLNCFQFHICSLSLLNNKCKIICIILFLCTLGNNGWIRQKYVPEVQKPCPACRGADVTDVADPGWN